MSAGDWVRLADYGRCFATRARAREIRADWAPDALIVLDWTGVEVATVGFIDELVHSRAPKPASYGMNDELLESLAVAASRRAEQVAR